MCVCVGGGGGGGGGDYNFVYFFYIFLSFGMILALNHVNFHFPTMFFSPAVFNFWQCFL